MIISGGEMAGRDKLIPSVVGEYLKILQRCFPDVVFEADCKIFPWPKHPAKYLDVVNRYSRIYYIEKSSTEGVFKEIQIHFLYQTQAWVVRVCGEINNFYIEQDSSGRRIVEEASLLPIPKKVSTSILNDRDRLVKKYGGLHRETDSFVKRGHNYPAKLYPEGELVPFADDAVWAKVQHDRDIF